MDRENGCTLYPHASIVSRLEINVGEVKLGFTDLYETPCCLFYTKCNLYRI